MPERPIAAPLNGFLNASGGASATHPAEGGVLRSLAAIREMPLAALRLRAAVARVAVGPHLDIAAPFRRGLNFFSKRTS